MITLIRYRNNWLRIKLCCFSHFLTTQCVRFFAKHDMLRLCHLTLVAVFRPFLSSTRNLLNSV